jgi:hypothetical protein
MLLVLVNIQLPAIFVPVPSQYHATIFSGTHCPPLGLNMSHVLKYPDAETALIEESSPCPGESAESSLAGIFGYG